MKYKVINTGTADQHIPTKHGASKNGVLGIAGQLGDKIIIPGLSRGEDKNFIVIDEETLRCVFGLYENAFPGVLNIEKGSSILMKNVKRNKPLLDNGRLVILDEFGSHVLGKGTSEYQSKVVDAAMQENQNLKEQSSRFLEVLVAEGYSEEDARKILDGKIVAGDAKLKKAEPPKVSTGDGIPQGGDKKVTLESMLAENGALKVGDKEYKSVAGAVKKLSEMAAEAGVEITEGEDGLPYFVVGDDKVTVE